ncbi:MAG: ABC transporter substrate-binding protein, partial [Candidatus Entotheonellia bacterium]
YDASVPWALPDADRARKVRLALNLAVDKQAIIQRVLGGLGTAAGTVTFYPRDPWATEALLQPYPYDPAKAKALLAEAGYPKGLEVTMNLTAWPGRGYLPDVGEAVATYWEKVGIKVKRRPIDRAVFQADFRARSYTGVTLAYAGPVIASEPWEQDVTGFDPHWSAGLQNIYMAGNLFNNLVTVDEQLNYVPELAQSWEAQDDGKVYVFQLHKGVKFHDGTDFDAAAEVWNFERIMDPEEKALGRPLFQIVAAVEALDAHTVKFTLKYPSQTLLPSLAIYPRSLFIKAPSTYKTWGRKDAHLHPTGTGPFKLARWEPNQIIVLEKNPEYFKPGLPYLDRIEFKIMKDGITRATALRAGEVDFVNYVAKELVERLSKDPKIQLLRGPDTQSVNISFHNTRKPFDDVRVRQALGGYGLDRPAIAKTAMMGHGQALWSFVPPGGKDHIDFGEEFPYNPEKARALLKDAGFDEKTPLKYTIMTHGAEPSLPTIATIIKTQLAQIGVEVTVEVLDRPIFLKRLTSPNPADRDWDQIVNLTGSSLDAYTRSFVLDSRAGVNLVNHQDSQLDALWDQLKQAPTPQEFSRLSHEVQRHILRNMIQISATTLPFMQAARDYVKGFVYERGFKIRFEGTWLDKPQG